jgi:hypothetical protein
MGRLLALILVAICALVFGCALADTVVVDKMSSLADGTGISYKLDPGMYKVDLTALEDGVTVKFIGCSCPGATTETQNFSTICQFQQTGQVTIDNPSLFGAGKGSTVTVKITRPGHSA